MNIVSLIKSIVEREAARLVLGASAVATTVTLWVAGQLGVELSPEFVLGVAAFAAVVAEEVIRQLVFSQRTTERLVAEAAVTGSPSVGSPPSGDLT